MKQGKVIAIFLCLAMLLAGATAAQAEEQQNVIKVSGEGVVDAAPDQAVLSLAIITENADAGKAQAENAEKSTRVQKALKDRGIADSEIQTQNYQLSPKHTQPPKPLEPVGTTTKEYAPEIVGYTVHHQIRVKVADLDMVGELMDLAVKNGANQVSNVSFSVSDSMNFKKQALQEAVAEARAKAEVLAAALGKTLDGVQSASGSWNESSTGPVYYREMAMGAGDKAATPVAPGMAQVRAHASITYLIK